MPKKKIEKKTGFIHHPYERKMVNEEGEEVSDKFSEYPERYSYITSGEKFFRVSEIEFLELESVLTREELAVFLKGNGGGKLLVSFEANAKKIGKWQWARNIKPIRNKGGAL